MLFSKEITHVESFDTVVVGGGVAGFCAAVASARGGAKTALIEDMGALGGILTAGGNPDIGIFYASHKPAIAGIGWELCKRLEKMGFARIPDFDKVDTRLGGMASNVSVDPSMAQAEMIEMCLEAGVSLFLRTKVIDTVCEGGRVKAVIAAEKCSLAAFCANVFIDCSGDGDVAYLCGAEYEYPDEVQPGTFGFSFKCHKDVSTLSEAEARRLFEAKKEKGEIRFGDYWPEYHAEIRNFLRDCGNNANHVVMDGASASGITRAEIEGRQSMARMLKFASEFTEISTYQPAAYTAPRETRRITCDTRVTVEDFMTGRIFPDSVSYAYYNLDLHSASEEVKKTGRPFAFSDAEDKLPMGVVPTVPYSAMTVKGFDNLLVAGRCISTDRAVMGAFRVKAACMGMGEAAGTAAALAKDGDVRAVNIDDLKERLREGGAIVPDASIFAPLV